MNIIFFSPHQLILPHSIPESLVKRSLLESGNNITTLGCKGILQSRCTTQDAYGLIETGNTSEKNNLCRKCINAQRQFRKFQNKVENIDLEEFIDLKDIRYANKTKQEPIEKLKNLEVDGMPIGKFALYETILTYKLKSAELNQRAEEYYRDILFGAILIYRSGIKIREKNKFDFLVLHNSLYCHNQVLSKTLSQAGTITYSLHCGLNFAYRENSLIFARDNFKSFIDELKEDSPRFVSKGISKKNLDRILEHIKISASGNTVFSYSAPIRKINIKEQFELPKDALVTLAVLSSGDELIAAKEAGYLGNKNQIDLFKNQFEWVEWLIEWAKNNKDRFLVIRIHPREMSNKRDKINSQGISIFEKILQEVPKNVRINWPTDNVSMYDFIPHVDRVLTSWSSAGKEFSALGILTISYFNQNRSYPDDIHPVAKSIDQYVYMLSNKYKIKSFDRNDQILRALNWLNLEQFTCALSLEFANSIRPPDKIFFKRLVRKLFWTIGFNLSYFLNLYPYSSIRDSEFDFIPSFFKDKVNNLFATQSSGIHRINLSDNGIDPVLQRSECVQKVKVFLKELFYEH